MPQARPVNCLETSDNQEAQGARGSVHTGRRCIPVGAGFALGGVM